MSQTPSNMLPLGTKAANFLLLNTVNDQYQSLQELRGKKATVIFFICNHCPFVIHVNQELVKIANNFKEHDVSFIAVSSNDVINYPQDAPVLMKKYALALKYPFPYLYDESQDIAKAYAAACTPDTYVFNNDLELVYRGQIDDSRPGNQIPVTGKDLRMTLQNVLDGVKISTHQRPSIGCNIKWKN
ncbi:MAG: thioredoxin family protein [Flavobacteriaceae bacterium]|nr:thioredoxin family protein [Flavobacteriaceae bacterium]